MQKKTFTPDYLTHTKKYNHGEEAMVVLKDHHEPVVDRELWDLVQSELKRRNRRGASGSGRRYMFSGKIKCGECGASFVSKQKKHKDGTGCQYWCCRTASAKGGKAGCDVGKMIRDELAVDILMQTVGALQMDREQIIDNMTAVIADVLREGCGSAKKITQSLEQLKQKKADALDAFLSKTITETDWKLINGRYEQEEKSMKLSMEKRQDFSEEDIRRHITLIVTGSVVSEVFCKNILDRMVIYRDKRVEVRFRHLPQKWTYLSGPF